MHDKNERLVDEVLRKLMIGSGPGGAVRFFFLIIFFLLSCFPSQPFTRLVHVRLFGGAVCSCHPFDPRQRLRTRSRSTRDWKSGLMTSLRVTSGCPTAGRRSPKFKIEPGRVDTAERAFNLHGVTWHYGDHTVGFRVIRLVPMRFNAAESR